MPRSCELFLSYNSFLIIIILYSSDFILENCAAYPARKPQIATQEAPCLHLSDDLQNSDNSELLMQTLVNY